MKTDSVLKFRFVLLFIAYYVFKCLTEMIKFLESFNSVEGHLDLPAFLGHNFVLRGGQLG